MTANYLIINEDGSMETVEELSNTDRYAADLGVIEVVNLQGDKPSRFIESIKGKRIWEDVEPRG